MLKISAKQLTFAKDLATRNSTKESQRLQLDKLDKEAQEKFNNILLRKKLIVTSEGCSVSLLSHVPSATSGKSILKKKEHFDSNLETLQ